MSRTATAAITPPIRSFATNIEAPTIAPPATADRMKESETVLWLPPQTVKAPRALPALPPTMVLALTTLLLPKMLRPPSCP